MLLRPMLSVVFTAIAALLLILSPGDTTSAFAVSNQQMNQPAVLTAPEPGAKINIYAKPGRQEEQVGYGLGGDRVTVLEQVGSNEGYTWNYIRFSNPPNAEGWVRTDYLSFQLLQIPPIDTPQLNPTSKPNGYLGNRPTNSHSTQTNQQTRFSQQQQQKPLTNIQQTVMNWFNKF